VEVELYLFVSVFLVDIAGEAIVTPCHQLRPGLEWVLAQMFLQQFVRDAAAPELIGFGLIFGPGRFLATELNRSVGLKIDGLLEQLLRLGDTLVHAFGVEIVNFVGWLQIAQKNVIIERGAIFRIECIDIFLREKEMTVIEQLEISLEKLLRQLVVELFLRVMPSLEKPADRDANILCIRLRHDRLGPYREDKNDRRSGQR